MSDSDDEYGAEMITDEYAVDLKGGKKRSKSLSSKVKNLEAKIRKLSRRKSSKKRRKSSKKRRKSSKKRRKSSKKRRKSSKKRRSSSNTRSNIRYFTLMTPDGRVIGGRYSGSTPQQAAKKLRSQYFDKGNTTTVHLRQTSSGPNHNYTYVYKVKRRKVPATVYIKKLTGRNYMWCKDAEPLRVIRYTM